MKSHADRIPVLVGHPFAPTGRAEEARSAFRAFEAVGLRVYLRDVYALDSRVDHDLQREIGDRLVHGLSRAINIFYINGDEVKQALQHVRAELPPGAYNVICPQWELGIYPQEWAEQLDRFDEIWAPSGFVRDAVQKAASKPVYHMPLPVQVRLTSFLGRRYFGLPESAYIFLFFFDFRSYIDRKNPFAALQTFEHLCSVLPHEDVRLVIKVHGAENSSAHEMDTAQFRAGIEQCRYREKVTVIDKVLTDNEIKNLVRCSDCFVSLHRSEGFGRGMAEAMFLGKPVVATSYSGNLDFMTEENSCLVRYKLIEVAQGRYPHANGQLWAEPDIDHAVEYMQRLLEDRSYGRTLGQTASRYMRTYFSYRAIGLRYKRRLDEILLSIEGLARESSENNMKNLLTNRQS